MDILKIDNVEYNMSQPTNEEFIKQYVKSFGDTGPEINVNITWNHINGFYLNLTSDNEGVFDVEIYDNDDVLLYKSELFNNMFCQTNRKYFNGIKYKIYKGPFLVKEESISFENKKVFISFESSSLGDTICWIPYCEEFRKKHNCEVVVSTFLNHLFIKKYPNLIFTEPGNVVNNIHGMFKIGWFYNNSLEPINPVTIPLQQTITNILGLEFKEITPTIEFTPKQRPFTEKYITIATESTAGLKLWNNPTGWQETVNYLKTQGYRIINISKNGRKLDNVSNIKDDSMENTMNYIYHSEFLIGLSSGLSWLSWGIGKHVVMISNFTTDDHEFISNCTRITNSSVCYGCWNNPNFKFDKGDWNWCPIWKDTKRHFECHKSITSEMVINQIQHLL